MFAGGSGWPNYPKLVQCAYLSSFSSFVDLVPSPFEILGQGEWNGLKHDMQTRSLFLRPVFAGAGNFRRLGRPLFQQPPRCLPKNFMYVQGASSWSVYSASERTVPLRRLSEFDLLNPLDPLGTIGYFEFKFADFVHPTSLPSCQNFWWISSLSTENELPAGWPGAVTSSQRHIYGIPLRYLLVFPVGSLAHSFRIPASCYHWHEGRVGVSTLFLVLVEHSALRQHFHKNIYPGVRAQPYRRYASDFFECRSSECAVHLCPSFASNFHLTSRSLALFATRLFFFPSFLPSFLLFSQTFTLILVFIYGLRHLFIANLKTSSHLANFSM